MTVQVAPPPKPPHRPPSRRAVWLVAAVALWSVVLVVAAYVSVGRDEPTVREQRDIARAAPVVSRAVGELVSAAGREVVTTIADPTLTGGCRVTPVRDGATLEQSVTIRTSEADGPALLDRMAERLPADYRASVRHGKDGTLHSLRADAGEFVVIRGGVTAPGIVTVTVATGCRPSDGYTPVELLIGQPIDDEPGRVLTALGIAPVGDPPRVGRAGALCPGGGVAYTSRTAGRGTPPPSLGEKLVPLAGAGAVVVTDRPDLYAYRSGPLSVVVEVGAGEIRVATTSGCPAR